jgi:nicotinate-nucleotide adenylyltransferase
VQLRLDLVLLVPARIPPHKEVEDEPGVVHRLELCRRVAAGDARLHVCDLEIRREGPSYTVDTLKELTEQSPHDELFLILGGDVAAGLPQWRDPEHVLALATLAVAQRKGTPRAEIEAALTAVPGGERTCFFEMPTVAFSSTDVRQRVRSGKPIKYIVPDAVDHYIRQEALYRSD